MQHFAVAVVAASARPGQARGGEGAVRADPAHDFLRPARNANGAAAAAVVVVRLQGQRGDAVFGEQGGQHQADGAAAGDEDGYVGGERHVVSSVWLFTQLYAQVVVGTTISAGQKKPAGSGRVSWGGLAGQLRT
ncbi:hypothetical protein D9M69_671390 [compost metagenome]